MSGGRGVIRPEVPSGRFGDKIGFELAFKGSKIGFWGLRNGFNWLAVFSKTLVNIEQLWVCLAKTTFFGEQEPEFRIQKPELGGAGDVICAKPEEFSNGQRQKPGVGGGLPTGQNAHSNNGMLIFAYRIAERWIKKTRRSRFRHFLEQFLVES
jgi:hypothetical protein